MPHAQVRDMLHGTVPRFPQANPPQLLRADAGQLCKARQIPWKSRVCLHFFPKLPEAGGFSRLRNAAHMFMQKLGPMVEQGCFTLRGGFLMQSPEDIFQGTRVRIQECGCFPGEQRRLRSRAGIDYPAHFPVFAAPVGMHVPRGGEVSHARPASFPFSFDPCKAFPFETNEQLAHIRLEAHKAESRGRAGDSRKADVVTQQCRAVFRVNEKFTRSFPNLVDFTKVKVGSAHSVGLGFC